MTIPEVPPVPGGPEEPDIPDPPATVVEDRVRLAPGDRADDGRPTGAGLRRARSIDTSRSRGIQEEVAAEEAERQLDSELGSIAELQHEMTRLGAELEGRLP